MLSQKLIMQTVFSFPQLPPLEYERLEKKKKQKTNKHKMSHKMTWKCYYKIFENQRKNKIITIRDRPLLMEFGSFYTQKMSFQLHCITVPQASSNLHCFMILFFFIILQHFGVRILKLNLLIVQAGCPVLFYQMPQKQREQSIFPDRSQQFVRGLR